MSAPRWFYTPQEAMEYGCPVDLTIAVAVGIAAIAHVLWLMIAG